MAVPDHQTKDRMISTYEMKSYTMLVVAEEMRRTDESYEALDRVVWREAVKLLSKELEGSEHG